MPRNALFKLFILFVFAVSALGCNPPSTPPSTPDVSAIITQAAPTLAETPTEIAPLPTEAVVPAPPRPGDEPVAETTGFEVPSHVASRYEAILWYEPEVVMLTDWADVMYLTLPNEMYSDRQDLFKYEAGEIQHIPLETAEGERYYPIGTWNDTSWEYLAFDCVSYDENEQYAHITACLINVSTFDFQAMPLPQEGFSRPLAYDFGFNGSDSLLAAVSDLNALGKDQIFRWDFSDNSITQLTFAPVSHWSIVASENSTYAATESQTGDYLAPQYIQAYEKSEWKLRAAVEQGTALGWVEDKLVYLEFDVDCMSPDICSKLRTLDPATQRDEFLLVLPNDPFWFSDMLVSPDGSFFTLVADGGMKGVYSCYFYVGSFCSQIVQPTDDKTLEVIGFMSHDLLLIKMGNHYQIVPASPEKG